MFEKTTQTNLPLPDQLAEVRSQLKKLKADEKKLVAEIRDLGDVKGAFVEAYLSETTGRSLDTEAVKQKFREALDPFYRETPVVSVKFREIDAG